MQGIQHIVGSLVVTTIILLAAIPQVELARNYAQALASCSNEGHYWIGRRLVMCSATDLR